MYGCQIVCSVSAVLLFAVGGFADETRNPFGLVDIDVPIDDNLRLQAKSVKLPGGDDDPNAKPWPDNVTDDDPMKLNGMWASRWNNRGETWSLCKAKVSKQGDRLFIHCFTEGNNGWLIEAIRQKDGKYVGRYVAAGSSSGSGVWIGRIIDHGRIDGDWISGRWDLRRVFDEKKKEKK